MNGNSPLPSEPRHKPIRCAPVSSGGPRAIVMALGDVGVTRTCDRPLCARSGRSETAIRLSWHYISAATGRLIGAANPHVGFHRRLRMRINSLATNRLGIRGNPGLTRQTVPKRLAQKSRSISAAKRTSGWRRLMVFSREGRGWLTVSRYAAGDQNDVPPPNLNCWTTSYFPFVNGTA